jgi:hypothetical protein
MPAIGLGRPIVAIAIGTVRPRDIEASTEEIKIHFVGNDHPDGLQRLAECAQLKEQVRAGSDRLALFRREGPP